MKKMLNIATGVVAGVALMAGTAMAAESTYTINMCGASAQAGFWANAGDSVIKGSIHAYGCTSSATAEQKETNSGHTFYIVKGEGCEVDLDGAADDTIYIRYRSKNSGYGCDHYDDTTAPDAYWPVPSTCDFTDGDCADATYEEAVCMLGCSDVPCGSFDAHTNGWEDGFAEYYSTITGGTDPETTRADYDATAVTVTGTPVQGVVVPFGFVVNNEVTQTVCNYDGVNTGAVLAYDKTGWSCDDTDVAACAGNYKCIDNECVDGIGGTYCEDSADCTMGDEVTDGVTISCDEEPLKNVSRLMVLHIFSGAVDNWNDFGDSFEDMPIVACMRHAGSGTHQTLLDTVFRGDMNIAENSSIDLTSAMADIASSGPHIFHYTSSSDLTRDCIARFDGGIGYVDADKAMFTDIDKDYANDAGIHQLMYQGTAPSRESVANGEYNYWAAQTCYNNPNNGTAIQAIIDDIMDEASEDVYLTADAFGERAYYWATQGEMQVEKAGSDPANYPAR
jgi:hypothetical protein